MCAVINKQFHHFNTRTINFFEEEEEEEEEEEREV
jgi:hypothetical protein